MIPSSRSTGKPFVPHPSGQLITPYSLELEREFFEVKLGDRPMYAEENRLNHVEVRGPDDWIGLIACGHTYHETLEALRLLGLDAPTTRSAPPASACSSWRCRIRSTATCCASSPTGSPRSFVVEEKNPTLESLVQATRSTSGTSAPSWSASATADGDRLIPRAGHVEADTIAGPLRQRLLQRARRAAPRRRSATATRSLDPAERRPHAVLLLGLPAQHLHQGARRARSSAAGIGCHTMVMLMDAERVGDDRRAHRRWAARARSGSAWRRSSATDHLVQNIGDGTLFHSGILAVRAAVAAGVNITYKILYNGAVAMTGGQDPYGGLQRANAGRRRCWPRACSRIIITTEDLDRYRQVKLPDGVEVWDRERIIEAQEVLAERPRVHRADPRPALRRREAPRPQARQARRRRTSAS